MWRVGGGGCDSHWDLNLSKDLTIEEQSNSSLGHIVAENWTNVQFARTNTELNAEFFSLYASKTNCSEQIQSSERNCFLTLEDAVLKDSSPKAWSKVSDALDHSGPMQATVLWFPLTQNDSEKKVLEFDLGAEKKNARWFVVFF